MNRFIQHSIIFVAVYLAVCYLVFYLFRFNLWSQTYYLLFELFTCIFISKQGPFYCKYIRWLAYAILAQDTLVCSDVLFDYIPEGVIVVVAPGIILGGITISTTLAVRHFIKARRVLKQLEQWKNERQKR